jgi:hypothetical protein
MAPFKTLPQNLFRSGEGSTPAEYPQNMGEPQRKGESLPFTTVADR